MKKMTTRMARLMPCCTPLAISLALTLTLANCTTLTPPGKSEQPGAAKVQLNSLQDLSIESLRKRSYGSQLKVIKQADDGRGYLASYKSDGLGVYASLQIPSTPPPASGYPLIIYVHGWVGKDNAPTMDLLFAPDSFSAHATKGYVDAGYVVLAPALRGHSTVDGKAADGLEFLQAWDNGSYLSPGFYATDVLNLLDSVDSLADTAWQGAAKRSALKLNKERIYISGHSQGGDVVLTVLAIAGEGSKVRNTLAAGSIASGCIPDRFTQAETYGPMANTLQAFMSGDGSWTGSAVGKNGAVNQSFVFPYPSDWIATLDTQSPDWSWQTESWSVPSVAEAVRKKFTEMYASVNQHVADINDAAFELTESPAGSYRVTHDERVKTQMAEIGGFGMPHYLTEPLNLHFSDRDYYSFPAWNKDLKNRINALGGSAQTFEYQGVNHGLRVSKHSWFSPAGTQDGLQQMIKNDTALFQ